MKVMTNLGYHGSMVITNLPWTKDRILDLLRTNDRAVEKAIVAIYKRQTEDEKAEGTTRHSNSVGFRSNHAVRGTYYAQWVLSGKKLTREHLSIARNIAMHYHRQLCEIANAKESLKGTSP